MKFTYDKADITKNTLDMAVLGVFHDALDKNNNFRILDRSGQDFLTRIAKQEEFVGKEEQSLLVHTEGRLKCARVLVLGLGKREEFELPQARHYAARAAREANTRGCESILLDPPPVDISNKEQLFQFLVEGVLLGQYRFDRYKSKDLKRKTSLETIVIAPPLDFSDKDHSSTLSLSRTRGEVVARAVNLARDLVNEPPCLMTPAHLADIAQDMAASANSGLLAKIFGPHECEKNKMRFLLAVSSGSSEEPRFIHLSYRPKGRDRSRRRFVLVGKGVTFDSGGLSLKPATSMLDMKTDMAGAAAVLAVAGALGPLGIKSEVHILIPAAENMPSGSSIKVGDIIVGMTGKAVEIVNTDAEGRLILADALAYAQKLSPDEMIDMATLTGACVVALGPHMAGVMGNERAMVERFLAAARRAGEEMWPLPLPSRLKDQLKSPVADLKNSGDRWGGALTGGLFLMEFVGKTPWVHVDIAGPASMEKEYGHIPKGGTGFGVATLIEYLRSLDASG